eukprot:CAMPEP_0183573480 /NCGR_PEP_ID=MMETSP0371-20130417/131086_1 /TAXON_ID=268820 /ORGANISM="Peridinium aciculiferum, Strain PAER-2" /LENGTH=67 /DNA_ID=CAMNT_0025783457 /DNA_START=9 /DNA_END=208 /DNA_ORIENTATION=+
MNFGSATAKECPGPALLPESTFRSTVLEEEFRLLRLSMEARFDLLTAETTAVTERLERQGAFLESWR